MSQDASKILPLFLNLDAAYDAIKPEETPFSKGLSWSINGNPEQGIGTNNPSGEGQNAFVLTPTRSNKAIDITFLPTEGWNRNIGEFESINTNELYSFNYNSALRHCIFVIDGDTGTVTKIIEDPKLAFTDDPEGMIANIRVGLRYVKDKDGNIIEKHLFWTDGKKWQGWINVIAAIGSNGFDTTLYPYWKLMPPHFDREELLEWPVRPPMIKPIVATVPNTADDIGKVNRLVDKAIQFAYAFQNTDGRGTTLSPYSLPLLVKSEEFLNNPENLPKNAKLTFYAGSPLTEKILIYRRVAGERNTLDPLSVWGDWTLYDTIDKFDAPPDDDYWTRTNPWADFNYDTIFNTIEYNFDNSKVGKIVSPEDTLRLQTGMPQLSIAQTDVEDAVLLINNRFDYDNFSKSLIDKLSVIVKEKTVASCSRSMRTIYLYAYVGQCGSDFAYTSQVGYSYGADAQVRFGGLRMSNFGGQALVTIDESKFFQLDFADKEAFRCYLKGTPYYADGEWCIVKSDNSIEVIGDIYDFNNSDVRTNVQTIMEGGSYFMCRFKLTVPAGRYIATIGRHNVESTGDYRNLSTYIYGIANSRVKSTTGLGGRVVVSVKPNAIVSYSKEMEVDCTTANVDVWGNNADMFYIYCPYNQNIGGNGKYRFIEGYFKESSGSPLPVEMFPYYLQQFAADDWGKFTDKNGFYWAFTKVAQSENRSIEFVAKVNCAFPTAFVIPTSQTGSGWKQNAVSYLADHTGTGLIGGCNRVLYKGKITDLTGLINYSNISISIKDGSTVYTDTNGEFTLVVHNGDNTLRVSNVYVNAGGNYFITLANCGQIPLNVFSETLSPCINCNERIYPVPLNMGIVIQNNTETSLKDGEKYSIGCVGADLAGRMTYVNIIDNIEVSTFLIRDNINATYFQLLINGVLNFLQENPDIKWFSPYVSRGVNNKRYVQWVGDELIYLDTNGNVVTDPATAAFAKIVIQSLYDANVANNLSLLSTYQFVKNDRLRVYDDGDGNLFDVATFGDPIDLQILGTNYNQAAINAGLLLPPTNTVLDNATAQANQEIGLIVRYDARLNRLQDKTGFWIEIPTPAQENDTIPLFEIAGFYPIIAGEISQFTGYSNGQPTYTVLSSINIDFWDTYYLNRNINGKYYSHPFESSNVTDNWGANVTSGGRLGVENKDAVQYWDGGSIARSDAFGTPGTISMFREQNKTSYPIYPAGEIRAAVHTKMNIIAFICSSDWYPVEYNQPYTKAGPGGTMVLTNLDENLSLPRPKVGSRFGIELSDLRTVIADEDVFFWYDRKNTAVAKSNYSGAIDITQSSEGERGGTQSYINAKTVFINQWNSENERESIFDVVGGIDAERGNYYLTFRPRRLNTNQLSSYVNQRRNIDLRHQETFVYSIEYRGWLPCVNFTPEGYGRLRGRNANVEFYSFSAGVPYYHNNTPNSSFLNFYGIQCEPVIIGVFNTGKQVKILQSLSQNINGSSLYADMIYCTQPYSFTYIPMNNWKQKEKNFYAEVMRDFNSYPNPSPEQLFRSMLFDGRRIFGSYFVCRFIQKYEDLGKYFQLSGISHLFTDSFTNKP